MTTERRIDKGETGCQLTEWRGRGISTGDVVSISCENYAMTDFYLGLANSNGVAEEGDFSLH